jgi:hypothetical protein
MEYYEYSGFGADALVVQGELEFNQCDRWAPKAGAWSRYPFPFINPNWETEERQRQRQDHRWSPLRAAFVAAVVAAVSAAP